MIELYPTYTREVGERFSFSSSVVNELNVPPLLLLCSPSHKPNLWKLWFEHLCDNWSLDSTPSWNTREALAVAAHEHRELGVSQQTTPPLRSVNIICPDLDDLYVASPGSRQGEHIEVMGCVAGFVLLFGFLPLAIEAQCVLVLLAVLMIVFANAWFIFAGVDATLEIFA